MNQSTRPVSGFQQRAIGFRGMTHPYLYPFLPAYFRRVGSRQLARLLNCIGILPESASSQIRGYSRKHSLLCPRTNSSASGIIKLFIHHSLQGELRYTTLQNLTSQNLWKALVMEFCGSEIGASIKASLFHSRGSGPC